LVEKVRGIEVALGSADKFVSDAAMKNAQVAKKSIVAACAIAKGEPFSDKNLKVKRPGNGISPIYWDSLMERVSSQEYKTGDLINLTELP
jgi:N,N'-diacetyllegionaminate synthase